MAWSGCVGDRGSEFRFGAAESAAAEGDPGCGDRLLQTTHRAVGRVSACALCDERPRPAARPRDSSLPFIFLQCKSF